MGCAGSTAAGGGEGGGGGGGAWGKPNPIATFVCDMGTFKAEIYMDRVPRTASSFIDLAQSGFYNGSIAAATRTLIFPLALD